jgi:DNA-binding beta-propeller fold protein YncE
MYAGLTRVFVVGFAASMFACGGAADLTLSEDELASGERELWVTAQATHFVKIFNATAGTQEEIYVGDGAQPHMVDLSPSGAYAYVSNMGNGNLTVIRAADRAIVADMNFGATLSTHQSRVSPDGRTVLVHQIATRRLIKLAADEANGSWSIAGEVTLARGPICSVYTKDGRRAYTSLASSEVVEIDLASMTVVRTFPVGNLQCGLTMDADGRKLYITDNANGGRIWRVNVQDGTLNSVVSSVGVADLHGSALDEDERNLYVTARAGDEFRTVKLGDGTSSRINLDLTPDFADSPEQIVVDGEDVFVTVGNAGKVLRIRDGRVRSTIDVAPAAYGNGFFGRAVHGIAIRKASHVINIGDSLGD